uniref:PX domain-containing protein n=1 Tax=Oncorhynchus tshawytscha TaxID=74940 RepID=A0A8C8H767_ONCTS
MADTIADTRRLFSKPQNLNDAYGPPSNFLEIDVSNPETIGVGRTRFTTYEIRLKTNLPIFKLKESRVRRRYSDFEWLRGELERDSKVVVPPLPGKALFRQLPFRGDDGIFDDSFIEERRAGLEQFLNNRGGESSTVKFGGKLVGHVVQKRKSGWSPFGSERALPAHVSTGRVCGQDLYPLQNTTSLRAGPPLGPAHNPKLSLLLTVLLCSDQKHFYDLHSFICNHFLSVFLFLFD